MRFVFADDSRQKDPARRGMGPLVAIGGLFVPADNLRDLEASLQAESIRAGFPPGEEFKWSPGRDSWMHQNVVGEPRREFFERILSMAEAAGCTATIVVEDTNHARATNATTPEFDVTQMFLERVTWALDPDNGVVIVDRPGGSYKAEEKFLSECFDALEAAAEYIRPGRIAINVLCTSSHRVRLLQLADLVTGATLAFVAGEHRYSPATFERIKPMLRAELRRIGGVGVKIHPDGRYANLYHWLFADRYIVRYPTGLPLPIQNRPYFDGPDQP